MVPAGNKAKRLSSVNHTTKTFHHHHHHHHHLSNQVWKHQNKNWRKLLLLHLFGPAIPVFVFLCHFLFIKLVSQLIQKLLLYWIMHQTQWQTADGFGPRIRCCLTLVRSVLRKFKILQWRLQLQSVNQSLKTWITNLFFFKKTTF